MKRSVFQMTHETWQLLEAQFETHPVMKSAAVPYEEIDEAAQAFGATLPSGYREFIHRYGGAHVGSYSIYGIGASETMGINESSVFEVTTRYREDEWPGVEDWLIISTDLSGNPVGMDIDGKIWISDHDHRCIDQLSEDFEGFIRKWCLKQK